MLLVSLSVIIHNLKLNAENVLKFVINCRYKFSKQKFEYSKLQGAMKKQAIYEGTSLEAEVQNNAKSV